MLFYYILIISAIASFYTIIRLIISYRIMKHKWQKIEAIVISSELIYDYPEMPNDTDGWVEKVTFTYKVSGEVYVNNNLKNPKNIYYLKPFKEYVKLRYKKNQRVIIYYNPIDPSESTMDIELKYENLFVLILVIIIAILWSVFNNFV